MVATCSLLGGDQPVPGKTHAHLLAADRPSRRDSIGERPLGHYAVE